MSDLQLQLRAAPRFVVGAGLLLWGWQNGFLIYAAGMALLLETARFTRWRWPVTNREFNNIADLSSIMLLVLIVYIFSTRGAKGIFTILSVLPFVLYVLVVIQAYSESGSVRLSALFVSLRRLDPASNPEAAARIDLTLPFFLVCLLSASAGNQQGTLFFVLVCLLLAIVLWPFRPKRYPAAGWAGALVLAFGIGYAGQFGMTVLQAHLEGYAIQLFDRFMWRYRDPNMATTAMGSIGRIKLSDRIVMRMKTDRPLAAPLLLREATYDTYGYGVWSSRQHNFALVDPDVSGTSWKLHAVPRGQTAAISTYMPEVAGIIALPHGAGRIHGVTATQITRNAYNAVKMEIRRGWTRFAVDYSDLPPRDAPPSSDDLSIAPRYLESMQELANRLGLPGKPPAEAIRIVRDFFADGFTYSLHQRQRYPRGDYLTDFLNNTRSGHCEFFATSTVLLLRAAGVPARYAVGYSVDEYSPLEGQYVVRARHAHSWAMVHVDGTWQVLDTTPSVWAPLEHEQASALEPLFDLWAWASFRLSRWQASDELEEESDYSATIWLLIPLLGILAWRLYFKERVSRQTQGARRAIELQAAGLDSSFYRLVAALEAMGHRRKPGETLGSWLARLDARLDLGPWRTAIALHNRLRFDPAGLNANERRALDQNVDAALSRLRESNARTKPPKAA